MYSGAILPAGTAPEPPFPALSLLPAPFSSRLPLSAIEGPACRGRALPFLSPLSAAPLLLPVDLFSSCASSWLSLRSSKVISRAGLGPESQCPAPLSFAELLLPAENPTLCTPSLARLTSSLRSFSSPTVGVILSPFLLEPWPLASDCLARVLLVLWYHYVSVALLLSRF